MSAEAVEVDGVLNVLVEGQEEGLSSGQADSHEAFFIADSEMHQAGLELEQRFFGVAGFFALIDGLLHELPGQRVRELGGEQGQAVEKQGVIKFVLVFLAVLKLSNDDEAVLLIPWPDGQDSCRWRGESRPA